MEAACPTQPVQEPTRRPSGFSGTGEAASDGAYCRCAVRGLDLSDKSVQMVLAPTAVRCSRGGFPWLLWPGHWNTS